MPANLVLLETERAACCNSVIETLEEALAEARAGQIIAVGIAVVRPNGSINSSRSQTDNVAPLLGAMVLAQTRFTKAIEDGAGYTPPHAS